jgi:transglutaminase-like putative cysteine protease
LAAHRQSSYVNVTRALLTAGATLTLARVYSGASWIVPLFVAAVLPATILALGDRRRWNPLATVAGALVVGAWLAIVVDDPSETILGIPTPSAFATAAHDIARAPHVLRSAVVPVDPVAAALMLAVVATFVAALVTELVARRLEAPVGAIGPSIALYVAMSALGSGRWAPTTAIYAVVVVEYLVALQHSELETRRTWFQSTTNRRSQLVTGGAVAGLLAVLVAVAIGPGVPGARGSAWIQYRSLGSGRGSSILNVTSPLVSVGAKLNGQESTTEVFTVDTTEPKGNYWRVIALDQFHNDGWGLNSDQRSASGLPGPVGGAGTSKVTQTFRLGTKIDAHWLPAAYRPVSIDVPGAQVLPGSTSLFVDNPLAGLTYMVESEISNPAKAVLESVTVDDLTAMTADMALPNNFSTRARQYAEQVTKDARTPYDKALALMKSFHTTRFTYDTTVDPGTTAKALDKFLFETHRGFCEQYASAFAELARSIGLPTRVAVGYQRGQLGDDGLWHVQEKDAHAWPEVWLGEHVGWYRFEPTPGRTDPVTGLGGGVTSTVNSPTTTSSTTPTGPTTPTTASLTPTSAPSAIQVQPPDTPAPKSQTRAHVVTVVLAVFAGLLGAFLVLLAVLAFLAWRRTRRRRNDPDDRRRVLGAWTEALERLTAAGIERRPSTTSLEFALRQAPALGAGAAGPPLMELARLHTAAMYSRASPSADEADEAWSEVDAIAAALRSSVPRLTRWRKRWWSGLRRRSDRSNGADEPDDSANPEQQ